MTLAAGVLDAIGNTPLIRLKRASEATGCEILGKAEFMNPGGSIKDRAARGMVETARRSGALKPGGLIVEGTAGNTGIGLAMVGRALGHPVVVVMPANQAQEKKDAVRLHGAELVEAEPAPYAEPGNYQRVAERLAAERGGFWANQFDNTANRDSHEATTGLELWAQTSGRLDAFICAVGTGGTLAGVARALRPRGVRIGLADPDGSAFFSYYTQGELKSEGASITEGIGQGRITRNLEGLEVDFACHVPDTEALEAVFDLAEHEGLLLGGSAGVNVAGAIRMARALGPGHTVATVLCDGGQRYQSKLFNPAFLRERGLPVPAWL
ncbi:MAG: cysteine synthase A [Caulobacteraceae bacterium]|nr:cysteine synthase A [Caulobacter sp.]